MEASSKTSKESLAEQMELEYISDQKGVWDGVIPNEAVAAKLGWKPREAEKTAVCLGKLSTCAPPHCSCLLLLQSHSGRAPLALKVCTLLQCAQATRPQTFGI